MDEENYDELGSFEAVHQNLTTLSTIVPCLSLTVLVLALSFTQNII